LTHYKYITECQCQNLDNMESNKNASGQWKVKQAKWKSNTAILVIAKSQLKKRQCLKQIEPKVEVSAYF
jgi:hypothetical protein